MSDSVSQAEIEASIAKLGQAYQAIRDQMSKVIVGQDDVIEQLEQACQERSLDCLLKAVLRAVPEYQPSTLMQTGVEETA